MSKKTFGTILPPKPNGTLYIKYIDRYDAVLDENNKPVLDKYGHPKKAAHYKVEATGSSSRRVAQARLDELEKTFGAKNERERIDSLRKRSEEIQAGIDASKPKTPLDGMLEKYFELASAEDSITDSTKYAYFMLVKPFVAEMKKLGVQFTEELTHEQAKEYLTKRKAEVCVERYYQTFTILNGIYKRFVNAKLMLENPFEGTLEKKTVARKQKKDVLTDEELKAVLEYKKKDRIQFLIVCSLYTGLRLSDCALLKWANVKTAQGVLSVIPLKTQRHMSEAIHIPIHPMLHKELEKAAACKKEGDEYVYPDNADEYNRHKLSDRANTVFHKLGLNKLHKTFHSLRHTFISNSANNGTSIQVLQRLVGHSSVKMSLSYYHENKEVLDNAIKVLPDYTKSQGGEVEVVRLPKELVAQIRAKGKNGEELADILRRILNAVPGNEAVAKPKAEEKPTVVDEQIEKVSTIMDAMLLAS